MSDDDPSNVPATRDRRDAVREKAAEVHARQTRARRFRTGALVGGAVAVVAVVVGSVAWVVGSSISQPQLQPQNSADGFVVSDVSGVAGASPVVAEEDAATTSEDADAEEEQAQDVIDQTQSDTAEPGPNVDTVDIRVYVDYLSTGAKDFQLANVQQLSTWVSEDAATLTYYPVAMLTAKSNGTKYSLRAASAAACVATYAPESFFAYNNNLLASQPEEGTDGMSDEELADLAVASGVASPKLVRTCIEDENFASWARAATDRALEGIPETEDVTLTGTPMVLVNGEPYLGSLDDPKEFSQFVLTMASEAYYTTPTPTPTATTTPSGSPTPTPSS